MQNQRDVKFRQHILYDQSAIQAQAYMARHYCPHRLKSQKPIFNLCFQEARLSQISIDSLEYQTEVSIDIQDSGDYYFVSYPISGEQVLRSRGRSICSSLKRAVILSPCNKLLLSKSSDCKNRIIKIDRSALEKRLCSLLHSTITEPLVFDDELDIEAGMGASWIRTIENVENELKTENSLYLFPSFSEPVESALITGLLQTPNNYSTAIESRGVNVIPAFVLKAEAFIKDNITENIGIEDIVHASGTSKRTLYSGFKRFRSNSPARYLKDRRMEMAHRDILDSNCENSITEVALRWGINHLGRFSLEYKKRYGVLPSETLRGSSKNESLLAHLREEYVGAMNT